MLDNKLKSYVYDVYSTKDGEVWFKVPIADEIEDYYRLFLEKI